MHVILEDQTNGAKTVVCVDRMTRRATLLVETPEQLDQMLAQLHAMGVPVISATVQKDSEFSRQLLTKGWTIRSDVVVMSLILKGASNGKTAARKL